MSVMENAISRGIEAALKHIFINKDLPEVMKQKRAAELSHERDFFLDEVQCLLREKLNISQDADFLAHKTAACDVVSSYEHKDGPGPDYQNLAFDLANGSKSPWNARILDLLLEDLKERSEKEGWVVQRQYGEKGRPRSRRRGHWKLGKSKDFMEPDDRVTQGPIQW
ncbi:hypothetical protein EV702DRAFT_1196517 [Suillus placidus]|uniref:Uncharacterized protein n=1 Tax=Suillus placidus TaxID=48579 RepID=A0A9P6ZWL4_9AGAM|nr:hypothetical protein EV702DRAFT_1196517 [Suillus placidus]